MGEVTAGVIIPSVPAANAVYRHLKPTVSGHLSTFRRKVRRIASSKATNNGKMEDNFGMGFDGDRYHMIDEVPMKDRHINAAAIIVKSTSEMNQTQQR